MTKKEEIKEEPKIQVVTEQQFLYFRLDNIEAKQESIDKKLDELLEIAKQ